MTLESPTKEMVKEAVSAGFYSSVGWGQKYSKIQIVTIEELLKGTKRVEMPPAWGTFKQASKVDDAPDVAQGKLFD